MKKLLIVASMIVLTSSIAYAGMFGDFFNQLFSSQKPASSADMPAWTAVRYGATVCFPSQGCTGKGSATADDIGKYLKISNNSPFEYSFDTPAGGGATDQLGQIGDVSTSTLAYGHLLMWNGVDTWQDTATSSLGITGSGTVTSVAMSVPTGLSISGSPITTTGTLALTYDTGYVGVLIASTTEWNAKWDALSDISLTKGYFVVGDDAGLAQATSSIFISSTGNIGIGTTTPTEKLVISGTGKIKIGDQMDNVGGKLRVTMDDNDTEVQGIKVISMRTTGTNYGYNGTAAGVGADKNIGLYSWASDATENWGLYVDAGYGIFDDNVGIGTTSPGTLLSLGDTTNYINFSNTATSTYAYGVNIKNGCFAVNGTCITGTGGSGTVTSVDVSGGSTGFTFSGGPITTAGTITMAGTLGVGYGGTGLTTYTSGDILYANTTSTLAGTSTANLKTTLGLNLVENTALSTWAGTSNITTLGNVTTGTWQALIYNNANPTIDATGKFAINTTTASSSLRYHDGVAERALYPEQENAFSFASSTLSYMGAYGTTGTTTILLANYSRPITLFKFYCKTDKGTAWLGFGDGTASTTQANCSTSGVEITPTTNNTWVMRENFIIDIGRQSGNPSNITVTAVIRRDAD